MEAINRKATKLLNDDQKVRMKRLPVIPQLKQILDEECDFQELKEEDLYIIAPGKKRSTVKDIIIKGFTHYKRVAGIDKKKCFRDLRKTYLNELQDKYGDLRLTAMIIDHSNEEVTRKHYLSQMAACRRIKDFRVFD